MIGQRIEGAELWKSKARCLKLRIRDRFRVAVDRHCRHSRISDGSFYLTLHRLFGRLRDLRRESLSHSSSFYRKRVSKDLIAEDSVIFRMLQAVAVPVLGNVSHVFMHGLNRIQVYGVEKLNHALLHRPEKKPLLTVCNHVGSLDDPLVIAALLSPSVIFDVNAIRWTLCATDRCFKNSIMSAFFHSAKVLPVSRGDGIYQKGLDLAISKLNSGGWVHMFPEGTRSRDGGKTVGSAKRGVGRLVLDADDVPIVIPFAHTGMQDIMPIGAKIPRIGKAVTILVGDPIGFDDLLTLERSGHLPRRELYNAVCLRIGSTLSALKMEADRLALVHHHHLQDGHGSTERAAQLLQFIDWDLFGFSGPTVYDPDSSEVQENTESGPSFPSNVPPNWNLRVGFGNGGGLVSRIRGYMHQGGEFSFAVRGLYESLKEEEGTTTNPLKLWRLFFEENMRPQLMVGLSLK